MEAAEIEPVVENELAPISALQHMLYCPRQCALIHLERQWADNRFTAEGSILHRRSDAGRSERRRTVRIERSVPLRSLRLGLFGLADVIEMHAGGHIYPVEYKRGRPKTHRADEVQLCAQSICLEEMLDVPIPEGALFYGRSRRRKVVAFDAGLRALTEAVAADTWSMLAAGRTPPARVRSRASATPARSRKHVSRESPRGADVVDRWLRRAVEG